MSIIALILKIKLKYITIESNIFGISLKFLFIFYIILSVFLIIQRGGIDFRAFNFDTIYDLRAENNISGFLGYMVNWCAKVLFPFFFMYYLYKKNIKMILLVSSLQLLLYLSFGNKAFLFSIGIVILSAIFMKKNIYLKGMGIFLTVINVFSLLLVYVNLTDILHRAIPYRMLFIPAQIQYQYYEFFSSKDKMVFAEGFIGKIFLLENDYQIPIPVLISNYFLDNDSHSNTGLFADAYYNGGILGMLIIASIFALILILIDSFTFNIPPFFVIGSLSYILFVLNDTGLQTTLLTGGLGLMIMLFVLLNWTVRGQNNWLTCK
ncbi:O-antigen polymerase [Sutcliffiella horikoshii]|uniref:O-antigen polymerase n=1 Tax=Sutcliffiella horikoshii TaxID=79883 RepID=UPI001F1F376C|nr:O-antigen polymerase [Sutcliffiella horikoshii]MCG1021404.1 oligosaccharide repeat unit polymerase [Sutcliffiella horikoshii]